MRGNSRWGEGMRKYFCAWSSIWFWQGTKEIVLSTSWSSSCFSPRHAFLLGNWVLAVDCKYNIFMVLFHWSSLARAFSRDLDENPTTRKRQKWRFFAVFAATARWNYSRTLTMICVVQRKRFCTEFNCFICQQSVGCCIVSWSCFPVS